MALRLEVGQKRAAVLEEGPSARCPNGERTVGFTFEVLLKDVYTVYVVEEGLRQRTRWLCRKLYIDEEDDLGWNSQVWWFDENGRSGDEHTWFQLRRKRRNGKDK